MKTNFLFKILAMIIAGTFSTYLAQAQTKGSGAMTNTCGTTANDGGLSGNTSVGCGAGKAGMTGDYNTLIGKSAGTAITSGDENVMIGFKAGNAITTASQNVIIGFESGNSMTSATGNVGVGYWALYSNTTAYGNSALGWQAGKSNTTGCSLTAIGENAFKDNTTGWRNVGVGVSAGNANVTGSDNTCVGDNAGGGVTGNSHSYNSFFGSSAALGITTGNYNSFFGYKSGYSNTSASANAFYGAFSGYNNTTGTSNTVIGDSAKYYNATGSYNTITGYKAGFGVSTNNFSYNTFYGYRAGEVNGASDDKCVFIGAHAGLNNSVSNGTFVGYNSGTSNTSGSINSFFGYHSGYNNTTGDENVFLGHQAGYNNTDGNDNAFVGLNAGYVNTTGKYTAALGAYAGDGSQTGDSCTYVGAYSDKTTLSTYTNATAIGFGAITNADRKIVIGHTNIASGGVIGGYVNWSNLSDGRFKVNVQEEVRGLEFIKKLRPVTYQLDLQKLDQFLTKNIVSSPDSTGNSTNVSGTSTPSLSSIHTGFIAQEVEQAAKDCNFTFNAVHVPNDSNDNYTLSYASFVVPLVKAIQELSAKVDSLQGIQKSERKANPDNDEQGGSENIRKIELENKNNVVLYQNEPNPFGSQTVIRYFIPENVASASIVFYNEFGAEVKKVENIDKGFGRIDATTENLASGIYTYSIVVDGKVVDTKRMMRSK